MTAARDPKKKPPLPPGWVAPVLVAKPTGFPSVTRHHANVRGLPCVVTGRPGATMHHVHGRSVGARLLMLGMDPCKGLGMRGYSDALVIPLAIEYHSIGPLAIDGQLGTTAWEKRFGSQADHVDEVSRLLGYSLWEMHRQLAKRKSSPRYLRGYDGSPQG
jgi:hypothetical protein